MINGWRTTNGAVGWSLLTILLIGTSGGTAGAVAISSLGAGYQQTVPAEVLVPAIPTPPLEREAYFTNNQTGEIKVFAKQPLSSFAPEGGAFASAATSAYRQFRIDPSAAGEANGDRVVLGVKTHFGGGFLDIKGDGGATASVIAHTNVSNPADNTSDRTFSLEGSLLSPGTKSFASEDKVSLLKRKIGDTVTANTFLHTSVATNNHLTHGSPPVPFASTAETFFLNQEQLAIKGIEVQLAPVPRLQQPPPDAGILLANNEAWGEIPFRFELDDDIALKGIGSSLLYTRDQVRLFEELFASPYEDTVSVSLNLSVFKEGVLELTEQSVLSGVFEEGLTELLLNESQALQVMATRKGSFFGMGTHDVKLWWGFSEDGMSQAFTVSAERFEVVPEPSTYLLLLLGFGGMVVLRRRISRD